MASDKHTTFQPKSLKGRDLRAPVTAELRRLPPADRDRLQAQRARLVDRIHPLGGHKRGQIKYYVVRSVICFPLITWLFTPVGFQYLWVQIPLAALYGVLLAYLQPVDVFAGWLLMGIGALTLGLTGHFHVSIGTILYLFCYFVLGMIAGLSVWLRRMDGE